ncbi:DUF3299 domain-containing protein [Sediminitomix flava]|uniref:DUF3299 domain-containing protein n=1 Tax=Sediminitomix flava TaxID=379075 RepID=A0A315ZEM5_SEDFL|nr:DUF3299 domain-containing protein [Sediminitomix flava]PWJ43278.1 hypothetical protein BC781_102827 [Sediminitomix flava]
MAQFPDFSTSEGVWEALSDIKIKKGFDETLQMEVSVASFGPKVDLIEGQEITLSGYVMPIDTEDNTVILSSLPFTSCFFCGGAGPETVLQTDLERERSWVNQYVTIKGRLKVNRNDFLSLLYELEEVEMIAVE